MKKYFKKAVTIIACSCLFFAFTGCKDDEEPVLPPEDDDLVEAEVIPVDDTEKPFMTGILYYFNEIQEAKDDNTLEDNLARRFSSKKQWNGEILDKGDCLLVNEEDVPFSFQDVVRKEALLASFKNGALFVIDGGTAEHYQALCESIDAFNFYNAENKTEAASAAKATTPQGRNLWILSGYLPGCQILSSMLEIADDEGHIINDYSQGEKVSMALQSYIRNCKQVQSKIGVRSGESDLLSIATAFKIQHTSSMTIKNSSYYNPNKIGSSCVSSSFQKEYSIYPMYSVNEKRYYYYVHEELIVSFAPFYVGVYNVTIDGLIMKACQFYGATVTSNFAPDGDHVIIHQNSPATTSGAVSYSTGASFSLSGTVGYCETMGASGSVSGGMSVSSSRNYTVQDITVSNLCQVGSKPELKWTFKLREADHGFKLTNTACDKVYPPSLAGQTTFTAGADYIISTVDAKTFFYSNFDVEARATVGAAGLQCGWYSQWSQSEWRYRLPTIPPLE